MEDQYFEKMRYVRERIKAIMSEKKELDAASNAKIWTEVSSMFDYVINISEENLKHIRLHTSPITGEYVLTYWHQQPFIDPDSFSRDCGYMSLTEDIPEEYWVSEPRLLDLDVALGVTYQDKVINKTFVRYQSCVSNFYHMGIFNEIRKNEGTKYILEIGGGFGGLAHALKPLFGPRTTYIIVDIPTTLLFSASYLAVNNPKSNIYIYDPRSFTAEFVQNELADYDFVLLPDYSLDKLYNLPYLNIAINMMSFQEMSTPEIEKYLKFTSDKLIGYIYSNNIDRHPINNDLSGGSVTDLLLKYFKLFPSTESYDDPSINSVHPWFYRFYFGIPKKLDKYFHSESKLKYRAYVSNDAMTKSGFFVPDWRFVTMKE